MTARIVFLDTETTSLRPDRRAWEVGLIVREAARFVHPDGPDTCEDQDTEHRWFVATPDLDLGNADPMALKIGRFYERHPAMIGRPGDHSIDREVKVLTDIERLTRGAHLVGAVVSFDAEVLGARMRANDIAPSWHYHLIDVEALAVGYLSADIRTNWNPALPWKSDDLSAALGIKVSDEDRHTALGDAKWARAIYDAVMGHA